MKVAATLVLCVLAFVAGRHWPRGEGKADPGGETAAGGSRALAADRAAVRASRLPPGPRPRPRSAAPAGSGTADDPYITAWRSDRDGAERVRLAVLETMEVRRRASNRILRACLRDAGVHGMVRLRFAIAVESTTAELRIGAAVLREVAEGQPVPAAAAACLEHDLDGDDLMPSDQYGAFLDGYRGDVDYVASFLME